MTSRLVKSSASELGLLITFSSQATPVFAKAKKEIANNQKHTLTNYPSLVRQP